MTITWTPQLKMVDLNQLHAFSEPTYCRIKHNTSPSLLETLGNLENALAVFKSSQKQQDKMMSEAKLLTIMLYKRRQQLRREKSLQLLRRVQACMKRAATFGRLFSLVDDIYKDLQRLLSRSLAEKAQSCYGTVYSLRQHFNKTNSTWIEPVLPPELQLSTCENDGSTLQKMCSNTAPKVQISDSVTNATTEHVGKVPQNTTLLGLDEDMEDIGEPITLERPGTSTRSDNRNKKRKMSTDCDIRSKKKKNEEFVQAACCDYSFWQKQCTFDSTSSVRRQEEEK